MPMAELLDVTLYHRFDGRDAGPVLVLSNSLGTRLEMWEPQVPAFLRHFRVLRYDSRGHGRSAVPPGPYSIADLGRDLLRLLDVLDIERVHFCGLSKGGMVGQWLAIHASNRIDRLVLCNTSARIGSPEVWNQRIETVQREGMKAIVPGVIDRWFTKAFQAQAPEAVDAIRTQLLETDPAGYAACSAAVRDFDLLDTIAAIKAPTLVISGRHDPATPPGQALAIVDRIKGARLVDLEAAHLSNVEAAADFTAAVLAFLTGEGAG